MTHARKDKLPISAKQNEISKQIEKENYLIKSILEKLKESDNFERCDHKGS